MIEGKSFRITKKEVLMAYKRVKANKGVGGIDGVSFEEFDKDFKNNMYKLWNRMASGSYFPKAVRGVEIPKKNGKARLLGIPTIEDRIAQMVVRSRFEPKVEKIFLKESFGYRPYKSALDAVGMARKRCFRMPWVIEFDIVGLFDNISHEKLMKAVKMHTQEKWIILYIERFLKAPIQMPNGDIKDRKSGTPQGGVISSVLANLFMHYAFDIWMAKEFPRNPWERYADDGVIHCLSKKQALYIMDSLSKRMKECELEIHPDKTRIVYCRSENFNEHYRNESFNFLGYTFRSRCCKSRTGEYFTGFTPAVGKEAGKSFRNKIREAIINANTTSIEILSEILNPIIRGWMNYFLKYNPSEAFRQGINYVNLRLARWLRRTHKKVKNGIHKAQILLKRIAKVMPNLFYHWSVGYMPVT
ncbi:MULTISPECIES: group II intron reverse transcriptase/maturase [Clostridium]|uniref:Group II intron-encoded protein LtrA n=1 Tax=Clostridium ragsdalei P11 TaxID=1353534 RepID=A0A1A6AL13_9CLOT|nr:MULTISPECIES: group II intron reverse transcriptase/maturase [Clostridium]OBR90736.1 group II intron-encoded protein LtrA [Clostridium ragsdalei P11]QXE20810.1 group II intron reverse transcriptase/maturase [Clostridium sp. 001]